MTEMVQTNVVETSVELEQMRAMSSDQIRETMRQDGLSAVEIYKRVAYGIRVLAERGEEIPEQFTRIAPYLLKVAHGQLIPEVPAMFSSHRRLLMLADRMPLPEQRKLVESKVVDILVGDTDGKFESRRKPVAALEEWEISQVISPEGIRSLPQQAAYIRSKQEPRLRMVRERKHWVVNGARDAVTIDPKRPVLSKRDVKNIYDEMYRKED